MCFKSDLYVYKSVEASILDRWQSVAPIAVSFYYFEEEAPHLGASLIKFVEYV